MNDTFVAFVSICKQMCEDGFQVTRVDVHVSTFSRLLFSISAMSDGLRPAGEPCNYDDTFSNAGGWMARANTCVRGTGSKGASGRKIK
jgi:hypothetical protein